MRLRGPFETGVRDWRARRSGFVILLLRLLRLSPTATG